MKFTTGLAGIILFFCFGAQAQEIPIPDNYSIVGSAAGDLDKDGINELAVVYNTRPKDTSVYFDNVPRQLIIYKHSNRQWIPWKRSVQAILGSAEGGMWGDPFEDIEISNGVLAVVHFGGSGWKWRQTDKYRFQNGDFYLIGYSSLYGRPCDYWEQADFNLSTGKLVAEKEYENCEDSLVISKKENETIYKKGILITLEKRREKEIRITTPKYKFDIYVATKQEEE